MTLAPPTVTVGRSPVIIPANSYMELAVNQGSCFTGGKQADSPIKVTRCDTPSPWRTQAHLAGHGHGRLKLGSPEPLSKHCPADQPQYSAWLPSQALLSQPPLDTCQWSRTWSAEKVKQNPPEPASSEHWEELQADARARKGWLCSVGGHHGIHTWTRPPTLPGTVKSWDGSHVVPVWADGSGGSRRVPTPEKCVRCDLSVSLRDQYPPQDSQVEWWLCRWHSLETLKIR